MLHAGNNNKNVFKALIAAEYAGVEVNPIESFEVGVSNKTLKFLKMNPMGKAPMLKTPEGPIFESNAIARFVAHLKGNDILYGTSLFEYERIEQWIDFVILHLLKLMPTLVGGSTLDWVSWSTFP
ncbi:elongation factor 1-gamma 2 [Amborella trichopoda]|uniref:GST N-terminal domain-containing protein n=1 Tax=Amborella trichopoda TaxID=13333 RepID=W1P5G9_AMBTC|nr:elongation factor 1-gamma 2 [Amborella trichopoda]ERN02836.1 hypothetical protein AMTR_s00086p00155150 [Amborella trichopoda]|eukprot:XP_006841161.1 elongation factor 1-gamma 2 [Amborella trichopoda]